MNFLAHLFFSDGSPASMLGSLLGDFVKGRPDPQYSQGIMDAIRTHRAIDTFTDSHPMVRHSKRLISRPRRRYAGIIVDIFFDHYLCRHWQRFAGMPLEAFIQKVYTNLERYDGYLPAHLQQHFKRMIQADWLSAYKTEQGIALTINRVALRIKRDNPLSGAIEELENRRRKFNDQFLNFFPDLIAYCGLTALR